MDFTVPRDLSLGFLSSLLDFGRFWTLPADFASKSCCWGAVSRLAVATVGAETLGIETEHGTVGSPQAPQDPKVGRWDLYHPRDKQETHLPQTMRMLVPSGTQWWQFTTCQCREWEEGLPVLNQPTTLSLSFQVQIQVVFSCIKNLLCPPKSGRKKKNQS